MVIVSGPLALRMRRTRAAREGTLGLEVATLPACAARLAGGFVRPAAADDLLPAIATALAGGGLVDLGQIATMPGTPRAILRTLGDLWRAGRPLPGGEPPSARTTDLALLDARVRAVLPPGVLVPPDLVDAALSRVHHAPAVLGAVAIEGVLDVDPVWRPLLAALSDRVPLSWTTRGDVDRDWFPGLVEVVSAASPAVSAVDACADPRAEAVEALRWARALLARGDVDACDVAIVATDTEPYDVHLPVLAREAGLPLHCTHGLAALETRDGQVCAALADALLRGPTQARLRRLLRRTAVDGVPRDWSHGLPRGALLATVEQWRFALAAARPRRVSGEVVEEVLPGLVALLACGPPAAAEAGERLLHGSARRLWCDALRTGPSAALELSLAALRRSDPAEPAGCIGWGPASHLAAAPRPYVRLLGLTARGWPRSDSEDPLAPAYLGRPAPMDVVRHDLLHHAVIVGAATGCLATSRPRRTADGGASPPSRLWPPKDRVVPRGRIPARAYGEADRLLARPTDARAAPLPSSGLECWRARRAQDLTPHDGLVPRGHPMIEEALAGTLTVDALRRLLRDPLAFLLMDVLGFRATDEESASLTLDPRGRGELVHELLGRSVDALEAAGRNKGGEEAAAAVDAAARAIASEWPLSRAVPPPLPWRQAVEAAAALAVAGLRRTPVARDTTRWTEVPFGGTGSAGRVPPGWGDAGAIAIGSLRVRGRIDRLDLTGDGAAARVIDWKTGEPPPDGTGLAGGLELQRVVYAEAVRRARPSLASVRAVILHLGGEMTARVLEAASLDRCRSALEAGVGVAAGRLREGFAVPGAAVRGEPHDPIRLALPADLDGWMARKAAAFDAVHAPLRPLWEHP